MNVLKRFWRYLFPLVEAKPAPVIPDRPGHMGVSAQAIARAAAKPAGRERAAAFLELFPLPEPPPGIPDDERSALKLAMDDAIQPLYGYTNGLAFHEGIGFLGYPFLAELTQRAEYRVISETRAKEMTRKWIELEYAGDDPNTEKLDVIRKEMERLGVQHVFRRAAEHEGFYGRGQIYIDLGTSDNPLELLTRLILMPAKIKKGSLKAFRNVEPIWVYPNAYNARDPLKPDYFKPSSWWVMGKRVHSTRLMMMISREMPDLLKAAYSFGGLSLSQMAMPYVDNWLRARQSVSDLMHAFSIVVLATNMQSTLQEGDDGQTLFNRLDLFNVTRDNRGTFAIDKDSEELTNLAVPLSSIDKLQAQAQEQQAAVCQTPLVKLLGVTPSGLNASSEGEIRVFYDLIHSLQEHMFRDPLMTVIKVIQLSKFGAIDENVGFKFVPLWQLDEAGEALVKKTEADIDAVYIEAGVVDPEEVREALAGDPHSRYAGLDASDVPEPPEEETAPNTSGDPAKQAEPRSEERDGT